MTATVHTGQSHTLRYVTSIATVVSAIPFKPSLSGSWFSLAMLLMALLGVTFGTLSILAATVASFKAVGDGAEVRVLICIFYFPAGFTYQEQVTGKVV